MLEGDHGELTAPHHGQGNAADQGHDFVAAVLAAVEAGVGVLPHTVHGMGALWLSEDIFELDLRVGITSMSYFVMYTRITVSC